MQPEAVVFLEDVKRYASDALEFSHEQSFDAFARNKQFRYAVERCFTIIGEALNRLRKIDAPTAQRLTDWQDVIGFRNLLVHGYEVINDLKTWDTLQHDLPVLLREVNALLAEAGGA